MKRIFPNNKKNWLKYINNFVKKSLYDNCMYYYLYHNFLTIFVPWNSTAPVYLPIICQFSLVTPPRKYYRQSELPPTINLTLFSAISIILFILL